MLNFSQLEMDSCPFANAFFFLLLGCLFHFFLFLHNFIKKNAFILFTREMQSIVGQASDFVEVVSKIDWTLLHEIWWRKIEKIKGDWRTTLWYVFFFFCAWTHQPTHEFDCRTSSGCSCLWGTHVGGHARTRYRVGPGLRLPMRKKENGEKRLKQLHSRSQLAPS